MIRCLQIPSWTTLDLYYDPDDVINAWMLLLNASTLLPALKEQATFTADIVAVATQGLTNRALQLYYNAVNATVVGNRTEFGSIGKSACRSICTWGLPITVHAIFMNFHRTAQ